MAAPNHVSGLVATPVGVYAVDDDGGRKARVVRVDGSSGAVVARSAPLGVAGSVAYIDGALWASASAPGSQAGTGPQILVRIDPSTLAATGRTTVAATTGYGGAVAAGPDGLWVATGSGLARVDPTTSSVADRVAIPGQVGRATLAVGGATLYDSVSRQEGVFVLQVRRADMGSLLASMTIRAAAPGGMDLAASASYVWAAGGFPGAPGDLDWYGIDPLRLLGATPGDPPALSAGETALPRFGEFPTVDLSGGLIWIAGTGVLTCIDPISGVVEATTTSGSGPTILGPIVVTSTAVLAVVHNQDGAESVAPIKSPSACRSVPPPAGG